MTRPLTLRCPCPRKSLRTSHEPSCCNVTHDLPSAVAKPLRRDPPSERAVTGGPRRCPAAAKGSAEEKLRVSALLPQRPRPDFRTQRAGSRAEKKNRTVTKRAEKTHSQLVLTCQGLSPCPLGSGATWGESLSQGFGGSVSHLSHGQALCRAFPAPLLQTTRESMRERGAGCPRGTKGYVMQQTQSPLRKAAPTRARAAATSPSQTYFLSFGTGQILTFFYSVLPVELRAGAWHCPLPLRGHGCQQASDMAERARSTAWEGPAPCPAPPLHCSCPGAPAGQWGMAGDLPPCPPPP